MCGIGGILRTDGEPIPQAWLELIDRRIAHRGPDGHGTFRDRVEQESEGEARVVEVALVHRRLSIIDLDGGGQPMVSEQGRDETEGLVAVVFNGCIYNHRELRAELEDEGHRFQTDHSDTEVLIHGYRQWGPDFTERLEGMYAIALWDRSRQSLVLARDWFGEKPLYLRQGLGDNSRIIAFGSDARSLAELTDPPGLANDPAGDRRLPRAGDEVAEAWGDVYLQTGYSPGQFTVYASAGGDGVASAAPTIVEKIDDLLPAKQHESASQSDFEELLELAVARRLESDVPLGCFLSGGVDSSLIALFAREHQSDIRTFCVRMPDDRYDESAHAERVAEHLGTTHTTLEVAANPAKDLVHLVHTLGQPFGDSSLLPTYWVSRAARAHVKVALTGDGGDELFFGYQRYVAARHAVRHRRVLRWLPRSLLNGMDPKSRRHKLGRLGDMARDMTDLGVLAMESIFTQDEIAQLVGGQPRRRLDEPFGLDPMRALRRADLLHYLPDDLLLKVDTAAMAVGLETRVPFLDRDVVRAALAAPTWQLVPNGRRKGLLKNIARKYLPSDIVDRPKMGFAIPIGQWFRSDHGSMRSLLLDHLNAAGPFGPFKLDRRVVKTLIDDHLAGRRDYGQRLFSLLTLSIWARSL